MDIVNFLVLAFATYRISSLFVEESGPFNIFGKLRYLIGIRYDAQSIPYAKFETGVRHELIQLFLCTWCMSVWVGVGLTVFYVFIPVLAFWMCLPFALSAFALLIQGRVQ